jgi:hypothetical protein
LAKGKEPKPDWFSLAGPPVPERPTLAGPIPKEAAGGSVDGKVQEKKTAAKKAPGKPIRCTTTCYPDPSAPRIPIIRGEDGSLKFDVRPIPGGAAPAAGRISKAPIHHERAEGIHAWINEASSKGIFDRTNGVQDQEGFTAFLGEFDPSKMKYSDYHEKYQEFLAGRMPGKMAGQSLLGAGLIPTAVPPFSLKVTPEPISAKAPGPSAKSNFGNLATAAGTPLPGTGILARPNGVPATWRVVLGKKAGHIKYVNPENPKFDFVRVKPNGEITQIRNGWTFDKDGNRVPTDSKAAHGIKADEFVFREENSK